MLSPFPFARGRRVDLSERTGMDRPPSPRQPMKKLASILAAAVSLAACQPAEDPADTYRKALPTSETLTITAPAATADAAATTALTAPTTTVNPRAITATGKSEFAAASYSFAYGVNTGVAGMLWLIP